MSIAISEFIIMPRMVVESLVEGAGEYLEELDHKFALYSEEDQAIFKDEIAKIETAFDVTKTILHMGKHPLLGIIDRQHATTGSQAVADALQDMEDNLEDGDEEGEKEKERFRKALIALDAAGIDPKPEAPRRQPRIHTFFDSMDVTVNQWVLAPVEEKADLATQYLFEVVGLAEEVANDPETYGPLLDVLESCVMDTYETNHPEDYNKGMDEGMSLDADLDVPHIDDLARDYRATTEVENDEKAEDRAVSYAVGFMVGVMHAQEARDNDVDDETDSDEDLDD